MTSTSIIQAIFAILKAREIRKSERKKKNRKQREKEKRHRLGPMGQYPEEIINT